MGYIEEFKATRRCTEYNYLLEARVYSEENLESIRLTPGRTSDIAVTHNDTVTEILNAKGRTAALNFADGYEPGGLVLVGATTQEEALCRSSNLYESIILPECIRDYYEYNSKDVRYSDGKSSDRIIYTRNVTFFRDSRLNWLPKEEIRQCDIITCPAPISGTATMQEIENRMINILKVAEDNHVDSVILGCWGCGAFGNSWTDFSKIWKKILENYRVDMQVIFAIMNNDMD